MLKIRLFRVGKKNQPAFKIVVTDKRLSSTRGRFVEEVGFYNPLTKQRNLKGDRVKYWISQGAQPSDTVHNMLVSDSVIEGQKLPKHKKSKKPVESAVEAEKPAESASSADQSTPAAAAEAAQPAEATPEAPKEQPKADADTSAEAESDSAKEDETEEKKA